MAEVLSRDEVELRRHERLQELEQTIEEGMARFVEVGLALTEIREHALYVRAGYHTFEDYCRERWSFSTGRARQLIAGAKAVTSGNAPDARSEREARAKARSARKSAEDDLHAEMHDFLHEHPVYDVAGVMRAEDVPEGVRVSRVGELVAVVSSRRTASWWLAARLENAALNDREYAYLRAALEQYQAATVEHARAAKKALKAARRRGFGDRRNDGRQWNPPSEPA